MDEDLKAHLEWYIVKADAVVNYLNTQMRTKAISAVHPLKIIQEFVEAHEAIKSVIKGE